MLRKKRTVPMNGPKLLLVESPSKIKTIAKFLGSDFKIMSTFGHIKDLPSKKLGINERVDGGFELDYVTIKDKASVIADICKQASKSSEIYLASDPDREGEIISWHIGQEIEKVFPDDARIYRISFNEITQEAVEQAIEQKKKINMDMVNAQQARRILDRWVGYEVSPILWKKVAKGLSAGRVQSVALMLICNREQEIILFVPEESWSITGTFVADSGALCKAELYKIKDKTIKIKTKEEADKIVTQLQDSSFVISKITEKERAKNPLPPFMTSSLQQEAYNRLGFSVDKTMMIAQKLYEGITLADQSSQEALITYMRTDSLRIADSALKSVRTFIKKSFGDDYLPKSAKQYQKSGAQDAHEAIRPIDMSKTPEFVARFAGRDEARLYELIWKRFVACQMESARYFQRQLLIDDKKHLFKATGSTLIFDGFLKVYLVEDDDEEKNEKIPKEFIQGLAVALNGVAPKQHFTQPPPRYTEATLVKELEKQGIGRPSTYAATLSTIQKRGYVHKENKRFMPSVLGKTVNEMLVANLPDIINISFTAQMEENLDKIAQGSVNRDVVLQDFYKKFKEDLMKFGGEAESKKAQDTDLSCPECQKPLVIRFSRNGEFVGCSAFPECKFTSAFTRSDDGKILLEAKDASVHTELACPQCGKLLVKKMGKYGPFYSCPGYPDCKYIHQESLRIPCPSCGQKLVKRRWKGGSFWGCTGYPSCSYSVFGAVSEEPCPSCDAPYLVTNRDKASKELLVTCIKKCGYTSKVQEEA